MTANGFTGSGKWREADTTGAEALVAAGRRLPANHARSSVGAAWRREQPTARNALVSPEQSRISVKRGSHSKTRNGKSWGVQRHSSAKSPPHGRPALALRLMRCDLAQ